MALDEFLKPHITRSTQRTAIKRLVISSHIAEMLVEENCTDAETEELLKDICRDAKGLYAEIKAIGKDGE